MTELVVSYSVKLANSVFLTLLFLGIYSLTRFLINRKIKNKKVRSQQTTRLKYGFFILFMIFFIRIWVEGFVQILAFFGFFAAAITLTQKDNLMNLVGWLIINWRGLFIEDDYIKISNYSGYIKSLGFLYFTLLEASPDFPDSVTGRIIKVPNGMVARNPIINFSQEKFTECTMSFIFRPTVSMNSIDQLFLSLKGTLTEYLQSHDTLTAQVEPRYQIKIRQEKPTGYELVILFYCKHFDKVGLQAKVNHLIADFNRCHHDSALAFD